MGQTLAVAGPIVRYVKDAALMLDVMKGFYEGDRFSIPSDKVDYLELVNEKPEKLKIGFTLDLGYAKVIDSEVENSILNSITKYEEFGWSIEKVKMKLRKPELPFYTFWTAMLAYDFKQKLKEWEDKMDPDFVKLVKVGLGYDGMSLPKAIAARNKVHETIFKIFKEFDILITPTTAVPAFDLGIMFPPKINNINVSPTGWQPFSFPFNLTGNPAASIPCGWSSEGLPIGMQIVGSMYDELKVLQVSKAFEEIAPWQDKRPNFG
jgi:aspartyl-tRNA(Asn)/glutamyl-tRNA(Gln) amidotransferase subunit A